MKLSDFYYELPPHLIAQTPIEKRDSSRLLTLSRQTGEMKDEHFYDILNYLKEGDCLVINNSKVLPARLFGNKEESSVKFEVVLLKQHIKDEWEILIKPGKKAKVGTKIIFGDGLLKGEITDIVNDGNRIIKFLYNGLFYNVLDEIGNMPLPPYIKETLKDKSRYQTVYAKELGSAAAPTAGLHFTEELLEKIKCKGVKVVNITLHVGLGTFRPVKTENITEHIMHSEYYSFSQEAADIINETKKNGGRVIAVGTTSCRTLESVGENGFPLKETEDETSIFIYPGYTFKVVDALITNFHLPESTLIMLISAFCDKEKIFNAYNHAIKEEYRFFSFGDAMFIY